MVELNQIIDARTRIADYIKQTPLLTSENLSKLCGNELFLKAEHLQKTGSFKVRGASNKVIQAHQNGRKLIVAASSGNHGQAAAYIANLLGMESIIVVPENIATCKKEAIEACNGKVELCGTTSPERLERAAKICEEQGAEWIAPYDDPHIIAGQGTAGLEILEQLDDVDVIYVPVGGGGLISGIATAVKEKKPTVKVIGVEPALANDTYLSFRNKTRTSINETDTIADGLRTSIPGELTFPIVQRYVDDIVLVSEEQIKYAFSFVLTRMKQLIEPSGAVSVAAALFGPVKNKRVVSLVSGGNIDISIIPGMLIEV